MNLFYQPEILNGVLQLDPEESRHCIKVLRRRVGDAIRITDGKGTFYDAVITGDSGHTCSFQIQSSEVLPAKRYTIHIAISPTKNADRIEWFVEKSVEIGIDSITLVDCKHSERTFLKTERLQKVAVSAMKQSLKGWLPKINEMTDFGNFVNSCRDESRFIAYVDQSNPHHLKDMISIQTSSAVVLIGPEGDFAPEELAHALERNFAKVSLGPNRLRTETAGLAACHILNLIHQ